MSSRTLLCKGPTVSMSLGKLLEMHHLRLHPRSPDTESVFYFIKSPPDLYPCYILRITAQKKKKQSLRQRLQFWFYLRVQAQDSTNKGKGVSQAREAAAQWDTVLAPMSQWIWKGHSGSGSRCICWAWGTASPDSLQGRFTPGPLLTPAFCCLRFTPVGGATPALLSDSVQIRSGGVGADQEREKAGSS